MKNKTKNNILIAVFLFAGLLFVAKFSGAMILRLYVELGMGNCRKIPILCVTADAQTITPAVNAQYLDGLADYKLPEVRIRAPKEFKVIKQETTKSYYKKKRYKSDGSVIYLLYEPQDFFVNLFFRSRRQGINNDYEFISRIMRSRISDIRNFTDAFFVIMKGIFTPDLGDQRNVRIVEFTSDKFRGFISYNLAASENYFDCNIIDGKAGFFKAYIKDKQKALDLEKVFSIISSIEKI